MGENCVIQRAIMDTGVRRAGRHQHRRGSGRGCERFHVTEGGVMLVTSAMLEARVEPA